MKSENLVTGTILVLIGAAFLARNVGVLPSIPWGNIVQLWPVLLIVFGLQVLFPKGPLSILPALILIAAVGFALFVMDDGQVPADRMQHSFAVEESIQEAVLRLDNLGVADLRLSGQIPEDGAALQVSASNSSLARPRVDVSADRVEYVLRETSNRSWLGRTNAPRLSLLLHPMLAWTVDVNMGIGLGVLDLRRVQWQRVDIETGIANLTLRLADSDQERTMRIATGIGQVQLELPRTANIRAAVSSPSFLHNLDRQGFYEHGSDYVSPAYDEDRAVTRIKIDSGIANIRVRWI